jgi:hypothetical protein
MINTYGPSLLVADAIQEKKSSASLERYKKIVYRSFRIIKPHTFQYIVRGFGVAR